MDEQKICKEFKALFQKSQKYFAGLRFIENIFEKKTYNFVENYHKLVLEDYGNLTFKKHLKHIHR